MSQSLLTISKFYPKVSRQFIYYLLVYKNFSQWDPPCSAHYSQRCDIVLQIDWHNY